MLKSKRSETINMNQKQLLEVFQNHNFGSLLKLLCARYKFFQSSNAINLGFKLWLKVQEHGFFKMRSRWRKFAIMHVIKQAISFCEGVCASQNPENTSRIPTHNRSFVCLSTKPWVTQIDLARRRVFFSPHANIDPEIVHTHDVSIPTATWQ